MNIYGTKGKLIKGEIVEALECPNCGNRIHRSFGILRYFHVCWIPILAVSKKVGLECSNCRWTLLDSQVPDEVRTSVDRGLFERNNWLPIFEGTVGH